MKKNGKKAKLTLDLEPSTSGTDEQTLEPLFLRKPK